MSALLLLLSGCNCEGESLQVLVPALSIDATRVVFPDTVASRQHTYTLHLTSVGSADVALDTIRLEPPAPSVFGLDVDVPAALAPGASLDIVVSAAPAADAPAGLAAGNLLIESDASTGVIDVELVVVVLAAPDCNDNNDCTSDAFDDEGRCLHADVTGPCDDHNACTRNEQCLDGTCLGEGIVCEDTVDCTADRCEPDVGCVFAPDNSACSDDDVCSLNVCAPTDILADARGCTFPPAPDGTPCGAFTPCTSIDLCIAHTCLPISIPDDTPCNDGNVCTANDACGEGVCTGTFNPLPPEVLFSTTIATDTAVFPGWDPTFVVLGSGTAEASLVLADRLLMHTPLSADEATWTTGSGRAVSLPDAIAEVGDGSLVVVGNSLRAVGTELPATLSVVHAELLLVMRQFVLEDRAFRLLGVDDGVAYGCVGVDAITSANDLLAVPLDGSPQQRFNDDPVCARFVVGGHGLAISHETSRDPARIFRLSLAGSTEVAQFSALGGYLEFGLVGARRAVVSSVSSQPGSVIFIDLDDPEQPVIGARRDLLAKSRPIALLDNESAVLLNGGDYSRQAVLQKLIINDVTATAPDVSFHTTTSNTLQAIDAVAVTRGANGLIAVGRTGSQFELPTAAFDGLVKTSSNAAPFLAYGTGGFAVLAPEAIDQPTPLRPIAVAVGGAALIGQQHLTPSWEYPTRREPPFDALTLRSGAFFFFSSSLAGPGRIDVTESLLVSPEALRLVGIDHVEAPAVDGCSGIGLFQGRAVVLDACLNAPTPTLTVLGTTDTALVDPGPNFQISTDVNDAEQFASIMVEGRAVLLDISDGSAPQMQAVFDDPDLTGLRFHSGVSGGAWVLLLTPTDNAPLLLVLDVTVPGAPVVRLRQRLSGQPYVGGGGASTSVDHRLLSVQWPRAVLSTWQQDDTVDVSFQRGHGIASVDLAAEPPAIEWELPLPSAAMAAAVVDDRLVVARIDGISVISPPCLPQD